MTISFRQCFFLAPFFVIASALPRHNFTISVPEGFSDHGKADLICVPTKWYQILTFFAINYVSHAATVKPRPGQTFFHNARDFLYALALPYSGLPRAMETLYRCSWPTEDDLTKGVHAGAFYHVVKDSLKGSSSSSGRQDNGECVAENLELQTRSQPKSSTAQVESVQKLTCPLQTQQLLLPSEGSEAQVGQNISIRRKSSGILGDHASSGQLASCDRQSLQGNIETSSEQADTAQELCTTNSDSPRYADIHVGSEPSFASS